MTEVSTTLRSVYLAGPMRGIKEYNFPAFKRVAARLRGKGWTVESPHERDLAEGFDPVNDKAHALDYYMQFDLAMVSRTDAVVVLKDWEMSQGARLETMVAVELGHPVFELMDMETPGTQPWLASVNPAYVTQTFHGATIGLDEVEFDVETVRVELPPGPWDDFPGTEPIARVYPAETQTQHEAPEAWHRRPFVEYIPADGYGVELGVEGDSFTGAARSALPTDSANRKTVPITTGVLDYFPAALIEVSKVSKAGNDKHNPGQPLHHARSKSTDHADALLRHLIDRGKIDADTGQRHSAQVAWRALALLQEEMEEEGLAPLPRAAR